MVNLSIFVFVGKDDEQRAYHSESDVDEIYLMPEVSKGSDCEYEQYGFENKQFTLEHSRLTGIDYDLSVIDEIPYLDDVHAQYPYVCDDPQEPDEVLTIFQTFSDEPILRYALIEQVIRPTNTSSLSRSIGTNIVYDQ